MSPSLLLSWSFALGERGRLKIALTDLNTSAPCRLQVTSCYSAANTRLLAWRAECRLSVLLQGARPCGTRCSPELPRILDGRIREEEFMHKVQAHTVLSVHQNLLSLPLWLALGEQPQI